MKINKYFLTLLTLIVAIGLIYSPTFAKDQGKVRLAKTEVASSKRIDVNQIDMWVSNDGIFGSNPSTGQSGLYYPKGQTAKTIIYTAGLWVVGKIGTDVRSGAADYSTEFQPGMIKADGTPDNPLAAQYRVYKIKKGDSANPSSASYNVDYAEWPADQGAPINTDGTPKLVGDQVLFTVYNDYADHADVWQKQPIGLEVQETMWGYDQTGPLGNTIFIRFVFTNKGQNELQDTYVGVFSDPDLGDGNDDYVACDTTLSLGYVYNGDGYDATYGVEVPACGFDFFQGPIVPSTGSTASLPDGTVLTDMKILPMTAFVMYINGSATYSDPDLQSAEGAIQAYYYLQGLVWDGSPFIDPTTGLESKFVNYGDPVGGTGWLPQSVTPPKDMRMVLSSGPFNLPVNTPKEVVTGIIVGPGSDNLNSISVLKYYDKAAQIAYDQNFNVASPAPQPVVRAVNLDEQVVLNWDKAAITYSNLGYVFQGYNVYQGASSSGPWKRVATFDLVDGITTIWDFAFNSAAGALLEQPVQTGKDAGLAYRMVINTDYITNTPLVNGKQYYFTVTSYAYNPVGVPKVLENSPATLVVQPQNPILDTEYHAVVGDTLATTHTGPGDGAVYPIITIPGDITGHDYKVVFRTDATSGEPVWDVVDVTTSTVILAGQSNQSADNDYITVDGLTVSVRGAAGGLKDIIQVDASGNMLDNNLFHSLNSAADRTAGKPAFLIDAAGDPNSMIRLNWQGMISTEDYEIIFVDDPATQGQVVFSAWGAAPPYLITGYQSGPLASANESYTPEYAQHVNRVPFQVWMISLDGTRKQVVAAVLEDDTNFLWNLGSQPGYFTDAWTNFERLYFTTAPYDAALEAAMLADSCADVNDNKFWGEWWNAQHTVGRLMICMYSDAYRTDKTGGMFTSPPAPGTIIKIRTGKPNSELDTYTFSTADYKTTVDNSIAKKRIAEVNVFPNPYFGSNTAETDFFTQFVTFSNLPPKCTIRIFSLSGGHVRTLEHNAATPFERWYLINEDNIPVSSGIFLAYIDIPGVGEKVLKVAVINREPRYRHF